MSKKNGVTKGTAAIAIIFTIVMLVYVIYMILSSSHDTNATFQMHYVWEGTEQVPSIVGEVNYESRKICVEWETTTYAEWTITVEDENGPIFSRSSTPALSGIFTGNECHTMYRPNFFTVQVEKDGVSELDRIEL